MKDNNKSLSENFRRLRNQFTTCDSSGLNNLPVKRERTAKKGGDYESFLYKYEHLDESISSFKTKDLCYFFREKACESGSKYVISNMKRDMGIFKKLQNDFEISEILLMIEFIFSGEQTYLDISITQPTVLTSRWVNKIYKDSVDWANDSYVDKKSITNNNISKREWKSSNKKTKIGDWE